jgi:hypothetical protein
MNNLILPLKRFTPNKTIQLDNNRIGIVLVDKQKIVTVTAIAPEHLALALQYHWYRVSRRSASYVQAKGMLADGTRKLLYLHRLLTDAPTGQMIDHKNSDAMENTPSNLRFCSRSENGRNRRSERGSASPFKGVKKHVNRWVANIRVPSADGSLGKQISVGRFPFTPEGEIAAAHCYDRAAIRYHGEFYRLNFPSSAL